MTPKTLPPLPWADVNALDGQQVAERVLSLAPAREPRKWGCIGCDSSDALHAYQGGGLHCFSCGTTWTNVDAVALRMRLEPADACRELARTFGIPCPDDDDAAEGPRKAPRGRRRPTPAPSPPARQKRRQQPAGDDLDPELLDRMHGAVLGALSWLRTGAEALDPPARDYLAGRALDPERAGLYGFRSVMDRGRWLLVHERLLEVADPADLLRAGWWKNDDDGPRFAPPWGGRAPALVIPYRDLSGRVVGLRFRNLAARTKRDRYRDLSGATPTVPWGTDALRAVRDEPGRHVVHLVEGELNALTLRQAGAVAVGLPGAGRPWGAQWAGWLSGGRRVVLWYDDDDAGRAGVQRAADTLATALGRRWCTERLRRQPTPQGNDPNDLAVAGALERYFTRGWTDD